jgi:hypothetical protein
MTSRRLDAACFDKILAMILAIVTLLRHLLGWAVSTFSSRENLILENLALCQQVLRRDSRTQSCLFGFYQALSLITGNANYNVDAIQSLLTVIDKNPAAVLTALSPAAFAAA